MSSHLERELAEQPEALARLIDRQRANAEEIASLFRRPDVQYILIASRGSSSNAARYAQYREHRPDGPVLAVTAAEWRGWSARG